VTSKSDHEFEKANIPNNSRRLHEFTSSRRFPESVMRRGKNVPANDGIGAAQIHWFPKVTAGPSGRGGRFYECIRLRPDCVEIMFEQVVRRHLANAASTAWRSLVFRATPPFISFSSPTDDLGSDEGRVKGRQRAGRCWAIRALTRHA
jgi:hypothetical protein